MFVSMVTNLAADLSAMPPADWVDDVFDLDLDLISHLCHVVLIIHNHIVI